MKPRTQLVAEAIKNWIELDAMANYDPDIIVRDAREEGGELGHYVIWEAGHDWSVQLSQPDGVIGSHARFMGVSLEAVNHYTLAVLPTPEFEAEAHQDQRQQEFFDQIRQTAMGYDL
jgi:hypothetical protein